MDVLNKASLRAGTQVPAGVSEQLAKTLDQRQPTLTEVLEGRLIYHRGEVAKLEEAIAGVKKNPELEHVLNLLQRL